MIFIDADAYIGIYAEGDIHHKHGMRVLQELLERGETLVTSWEVVDEAATKLAYQVTKVDAKKFLDDLSISNTKIVFVDELMRKDIITLFLKQSSKKVSMTDCANMVIARNLGIKTFFSFDHHYEQNGFALLQ